jgi:hypothetical protein
MLFTHFSKYAHALHWNGPPPTLIGLYHKWKVNQLALISCSYQVQNHAQYCLVWVRYAYYFRSTIPYLAAPYYSQNTVYCWTIVGVSVACSCGSELELGVSTLQSLLKYVENNLDSSKLSLTLLWVCIGNVVSGRCQNLNFACNFFST